MAKPYLLEACVTDLKEAVCAEKGGADRLELCADIEVGGITPDLKLVEEVLDHISIPLRVMVRPRGGNFYYDDREIAAMEASIAALKKLKVDGVVLGCLEPDYKVDVAMTQKLAQLAYPLKVTFHKAFDETVDPVTSLERLKSIPEITDILTSGGKETAFEGRETLKKLVTLANGKPNIIAAGKVTFENVTKLHGVVNGPAYHGRRIVGDKYNL